MRIEIWCNNIMDNSTNSPIAIKILVFLMELKHCLMTVTMYI